MKNVTAIIVIFCFSFFSGCQGHLVKMNTENKMMKTNIDLKERQIEAINRENSIRVEKTKQLETLRKNVQANLGALSSEIKQLEDQNAGVREETVAQRKELEDVEAFIIELKKEIGDFSSTGNELTDEVKNKRILQLRKEIQTRLRMGL